MKKVFFILSLFMFFLAVSGQSREELEQKKQSTLREIEQARELLDKTASERRLSVRRVAILNRGIQSRQNLINSISEEIKQLDKDIDQLEAEVERINTDIRRGKQEYAEIIRSIHKNHTEEEKIMYLLASESLNQFYQRIKYIKYLSDYRERRVKELEVLILELEKRTTELLEHRNERSALLTEKESENRDLVRERNQKSSMVRQLAQDEERLQQQIREKDRIRKELEDEIRRLIEAEAAKNAGNDMLSSLTPEQKLIGNNFSQNKGRLPWPVDRGVITTKFGFVDHPVLRGVKIPSNGIDINSAAGTKARAVFDGEVTSVIAILGANFAVIIKHGEYMSVYLNIVDLKVKVGDHVTMKQELGTIFADPDENIAELTFQIYKLKELQDPELWLSK